MDVSVKECGTYAWWRGLKVIGKEKWPGGRQSIGGLTKGKLDRLSFIRRLRLSLSRIYFGVREGLPFYRFNDNADLCQVGVERCTSKYLLDMPKVRPNRPHIFSHAVLTDTDPCKEGWINGNPKYPYGR
jgi:hypothetical protein